MDYGEYIHPDLIVSDLKVSTKEEVIRVLLGKIYEVHPEYANGISMEDAFAEIMQRENLQTTGLGQGKAFPHARIAGWQEFVIVLGYCKEGIDFKSLDDKPVNFISLMISSEDKPYMVLKSMSNLIRFLNEIESVGFIFENKSPIDIALVFKNQDLKAGKVIEAQDIMRLLKIIVKEDDPIDKIVRLMHLKKIDVLPVVDNEKRLKGQISCFNIFEHEVPEFFKNLHTVSFVRNIDPFEKFFKLQKNLKVKDYLKEECATVKYNATLLEVIFLLTIKGYPRLFVTKDEKLIGVIDRFSILDRILFF